MLIGRDPEIETLDRLLDDVRSGQSRALVILGDAGVGKSALLQHFLTRTEEVRTVQITGIESESELAYAGLHQLCRPFLEYADRMPEPQLIALRVALGLRVGPPPDRFLVALAVLSLLADVAKDRPLVCVIDDTQWLDLASTQALTFVARRIERESLGMVFSSRPSIAETVFAALPRLTLGGLDDAAATTLLAAVVSAQLDERVRDRIIAETHGIPLAIKELPRVWSPAELQSGFVQPAGHGLLTEVESGYARRYRDLSPDARALLLLAAAEPFADDHLVRLAAARLGLDAESSGEAVQSGLCGPGDTVVFSHPIARSVVYRTADAAQRRSVHQALADVTGPDVDPDRHAWHVARARRPPDDAVVPELERAAARALGRGAPAAAAVFQRDAASFAQDPDRRSTLLLAAAGAEALAGGYQQAQALVKAATAANPPPRTLVRARLLEAQIAFAASRSREAVPALLAAARSLEPFDPALARRTYFEALSAALFSSRLAVPGADVLAVAEHILRCPRPSSDPTPIDQLLDAVAGHVATDSSGDPQPLLRALDAVSASDPRSPGELHSLWVAGIAASSLWDLDRWEALSVLHLKLARDLGALSELPIALVSHNGPLLFRGEFAVGTLINEEFRTITEATGGQSVPYAHIHQAARLGDERRTNELFHTHLRPARERGEGAGVAILHWCHALLLNGLGRYGEALAAARHGSELQSPLDSGSVWALSELVEAAARSGRTQEAVEAAAALDGYTRRTRTPWGLGVQARARGLVAGGPDAETAFAESVDHLSTAGARPDLARTHLVYGEWLRRAQRIPDARIQLRLAHDVYSRIGADAFADRAARELRATGVTAPRRRAGAHQLTPQEAQIAALAGQGMTNAEIATRLFLSSRTIEYHLHKVFAKLGVTSRLQLAARLARPNPAG